MACADGKVRKAFSGPGEFAFVTEMQAAKKAKDMNGCMGKLLDCLFQGASWITVRT